MARRAPGLEHFPRSTDRWFFPVKGRNWAARIAATHVRTWAEWNAFMFNACNIFRGRLAETMTAALLLVSVANAQQFQAMPRGPLARLVKTPDGSSGLPPYALADQTGTIQRYVESVPGIDLDSYVNQIVSVRHDTGEILLASQLELPAQTLYPMVGEGYGRMAASGRMASTAGNLPRSDFRVQQAEYVDNDDSTVELMEEGESLPPGSVPVPQVAVPQGAIYPDGSPAYPGPMPSGMPMGAGPMYYDPMMEGYPAGSMDLQYGGYPGDPSGQDMGFVQPFGQPFGQPPQERPHIYGEVEINFLRAHVMENTFGKLSEKYEFSPRFIIGFTDVGNFSGRVRYWVYGRGTNDLDDGGVHIDFDVFDLEATHRFVGKKSELELAAGLRLAGIEINDSEGDASGADLAGITAAADGWTPLITCSQGCFGWTYGGRLSILAGDWGGDADSDFISSRVRDDNVVVHELYAGIGFSKCCRNLNLNARLAFEMQNWHSDVLSAEGFGNSLGFIGPGVEIGAQF